MPFRILAILITFLLLLLICDFRKQALLTRKYSHPSDHRHFRSQSALVERALSGSVYLSHPHASQPLRQPCAILTV